MPDEISNNSTIEVKDDNEELLSFTNDYVFRRIFGAENIDALSVFLAAVLGMPSEELRDLKVDDPNLHREHEEGKSGELDVRVHTKSGEILQVEIQVKPEKGFRDRAAYYNGRLFTGQLKVGNKYSILNRAVSVIITDFILLHENNDYANRFRWYNIENGALLTSKQEINILELPKLRDDDEGTDLRQWLRLLKARKADEMEMIAQGNKAMQDVVVTIKKMSADEAERRLAEAREKDWRDKEAYVEYLLDEAIEKATEKATAQGMEQGMEQGMAQGMAQGIEKGRLDVARNLKAAGLEKTLIMENTGISENEYEAL